MIKLIQVNLRQVGREGSPPLKEVIDLHHPRGALATESIILILMLIILKQLT